MSDQSNTKIFGVQRTGNNWLTVLMRRNYDCVLSGSADSGWKHGMYRVRKMIGRELNLLIIVKHPLCWLPSIWRYRGKQVDANFKRAIRNSSEIEFWNLMYRHWLDVQMLFGKRFIVRYEELLIDPQKTCDQAARALGFRRTPKPFYVPTRKMTTKNSEGDKKFHRQYYAKEKWRNAFDADLLKDVERRVDWNVVERLGYAVGVTA